MRRTAVALVGLFLGLAVAGTSRADLISFVGTLDIPVLPYLSQRLVTTGTGLANTNVIGFPAIRRLQIGSNSLSGTGTFSVPETGAIASVVQSQHISGFVRRFAGGTYLTSYYGGNTMVMNNGLSSPYSGPAVAKLCVIGGCATYGTIPLAGSFSSTYTYTTTPTTVIATNSYSVGIGGNPFRGGFTGTGTYVTPNGASSTYTYPNTHLMGIGGVTGINYSLLGQPWTIGWAGISAFLTPTTTPNGGTTSVTTYAQTTYGFLHGPASASSTALNSGVVHLVTPIMVVASGGGVHEGFGFLTLHFTAIPEPGTALLLGMGAIVLGLRGRSRMRR